MKTSKKDAPDKASQRAVRRKDSRLSVANLPKSNVNDKFTARDYYRSLIIHSWQTFICATIASIFEEGREMCSPQLGAIDIVAERMRKILQFNKKESHRYFKLCKDFRATWDRKEKGGEES